LSSPGALSPSIRSRACATQQLSCRHGRSGGGAGQEKSVCNAYPQTQRFLNEQIHLAIMFESQQAFDHIDEIMSVPGIHAVALGPSDLAPELGGVGTPDQAKVIDDYRTWLIEAAQRHGLDVSMLVGSIEQGEQWIRAGAKIICYSSEVDILRRGMTEAATRLHATE